MKLKDITICLHCGCDRSIVFAQMEALEPLEQKYNIAWNNRIDRYPFAYPSYSRLINHSIATSPTEFVILINDRCSPSVTEVEKIIEHLENGYACSFMYNVGFMGFSKQLIRKIGWWDERFFNGGWEDRDWVFRIKQADLALYESQEGTYDYSWKSPLQQNDKCALSEPHFNKKWSIGSDMILKKVKEDTYSEWDKTLGAARKDIEKTWLPWSSSILGVDYDRPNSGPPGSAWLENKKIQENYR